MNLSNHIIHNATQGITPAQIAVRLNCSVQTVYTVIKKARASGRHIPRFTGNGPRREKCGQELRFTVQPDIAAALLAEANKRNIRPSRLARDLITVAIEDSLLPALLDEG